MPSRRAVSSKAKRPGDFAFAGNALRQRMVARIHQRDATDALGRGSIDLQNDASAHRVTGNSEARGRIRQDAASHGRQRVLRPVIGNRDVGDVGQRSLLVRPNGGVTKKTGESERADGGSWTSRDVQG